MQIERSDIKSATVLKREKGEGSYIIILYKLWGRLLSPCNECNWLEGIMFYRCEIFNHNSKFYMLTRFQMFSSNIHDEND